MTRRNYAEVVAQAGKSLDISRLRVLFLGSDSGLTVTGIRVFLGADKELVR